MNRPVRDWLANVAIAALVAVITLLLVLPAQGQSFTWKVDAPGSCTVTCTPTTQPPPGPVEPPPPPPPVEPPPPPAADPCAGMSPQFNATLAVQPPLELWAFMFRLGRGLTDAERACARARNVPGSQPPAPTGNSSTGAPITGYILEFKGRPLTNTLTAGVTYTYTIPNTAKGERVQLGSLEVVGTPDSMLSIGTVRGPNGDILLGPITFGRHGHHVVDSPGGTLTLSLTPNVTAPLGVQRN